MAVGDYLIEVLGYARLFEKAPYKPDLNNPACIVISKKSRLIERADEFEAAVSTFVRGGRYQEIKADYFKRLKAKYQGN